MNKEISKDKFDNFFSDLDAFIKSLQKFDTEEEFEKEFASVIKEIGKKYGINIETNNQEDALEIISKLIACAINENKKDENIIDLLDKIPEEIKDEIGMDVIKNLNDDDKVAVLSTIPKEKDKADIIKTINSDELKIKLTKTLKRPSLIAYVIGTIKDDSLKLRNLSIFQELDYDEESFIESPDTFKAEVIKTIQNDELKIQALKEELSDEYEKSSVIKTIKDDELKIQALKEELSDKYKKSSVIKTIKDVSLKIKTLREELRDEHLKTEVIEKIPEDEIMKALQSGILEDDLTKIDMIKILAKSDPDKGYELLSEQKGETIDVLKRLYKKNHDVIQNIDSRILDDKYLRTLGEDKINLLTCYPEIQQQVLELNEKEYVVFTKCIESYLSRSETDEWTPIAHSLLSTFKSNRYYRLINNIEDIDSVDMYKLSKILQLPNDFELETVEDIENYEKIKDAKCQEIMNKEGSIEKKKNVVLLKILGIDISYANRLISKYGKDIENLDEGDDKDFILLLKEIMGLDDENILREIFNECDGVGLIDKAINERALKTAYGKKFNEGLYETKLEDIIDEKDLPEELRNLNLNVYDAGTDFKMLITSVAAFARHNLTNFKTDWNRPAIGSQHFCASYIRNDMQGKAPVPHLCYGFSQMKEDALMLSGATDIYSVRRSICIICRKRRN